MIKLQLLQGKDVKEILKIISDIDKEDGVYAKEYFNFYFNKNTSEYKSAEMYKIIHNKIIVGCIGYNKRQGNNVYEIIWMYVDKNIHNKGFGSLALKEVEKKLIKKKIRLLVVETGYKKAIKFYEKNGFILKGKIDDFYEKGEHSWMLSKKFKIHN